MNKVKQLVHHIIGDNDVDNDDQHMDVDQNFTERVLSQMSSIDRETIDVLIDNGYQDKDALMAFDIKEDLPMLPVLNMAQKSLLRKALIAIQESEQFECKVSDLKADDYVGSQQSTELDSSQESEDINLISDDSKDQQSGDESDEFTLYDVIQKPKYIPGLVNIDSMDNEVVAIHKPTGNQYEFRRFREKMAIKSQKAKAIGSRFFKCVEHRECENKVWTKAQSYKEHIEKYEWQFICLHTGSSHNNGSFCSKLFNYSSGVRKHFINKHK